MFILSLVAPIMDPFNISLEMLKRFLTSWVKYRTSVRLTVSPPFRLIFTLTYRSHFIFFPFTTVTSILNSSMFLCFFFVYVMCNDALLYTRHYLGYYSLSLFETSPQNMAPTNMLSTSSSFSFLLYQPSTTLYSFSHNFLHSLLNQGFLLFLFLFPLLSFPQKSDALWSYLPHLLHMPLKNLFLSLLFLVSAQLCLPGPTNLFLGVLVCHLWYVGITRDTHRFIFFG